MLKTTIPIFILICLPLLASAEDSVQVELKSSVLDGRIQNVEGDGVTLWVPRSAVKSINGQPFNEYKKTLEAKRKKENESKQGFVKDFYKELMRQKPKDLKIDDEWKLIEAEKQLNGTLGEDAFFKANRSQIKKEDVFRHYQDSQQSVVEAVSFKDGKLTDKKFFFVRNGDQLLLLSSNSSIKTGFDRSQLESDFTDQDQDGIADQAELCDQSNALNAGMDFFGCAPTDPKKRDTDGDGWWDGVELAVNSDPKDQKDVPKTPFLKNKEDY